MLPFYAKGGAMSTKIDKITAKIERVKGELRNLGPMRPGSLSRQYRNPKEKKRPYYQVSYTHRMKSRTEYIRPENLASIRQETANFKRFRKLVDKWIDLALILSQTKARQRKD